MHSLIEENKQQAGRLEKNHYSPSVGRIPYSLSGDSNFQRLPELTNSPPSPPHLLCGSGRSLPQEQLPCHSMSPSLCFSRRLLSFFSLSLPLLYCIRGALESQTCSLDLQKKPPQIPPARTQSDSGVGPCPSHKHTLNLVITIFLRHG